MFDFPLVPKKRCPETLSTLSASRSALPETFAASSGETHNPFLWAQALDPKRMTRPSRRFAFERTGLLAVAAEFGGGTQVTAVASTLLGLTQVLFESKIDLLSFWFPMVKG